MDPVTTTPQTGAATGTALTGGQESTEASKGAISSDFETFLTMLTAQIENQDPLNPVDSSDYAVQLATFSSVEQQVLTNDLLREMQAPAPGLSSVSGWIGMEARTTGEVALSGRPVEMLFTLPASSQHAIMVVEDVGGSEVARINVTDSASPVVWNGTDQAGRGLPDGSYKVHVESLDKSGAFTEVPVESYVPVQEVRMGMDGPEVLLATGTSLLPENVTALRAPRQVAGS